ncbi:hypothetical protein FACS189493_4200 [Spirochaetia bacterium]|nr:hypothetical protein FACS189493_4200 [Spirochaetia bacterium]
MPVEIEAAAVQWEIIDHKTAGLGEELPEWVDRYITGGLEALEALPQYADKYVFVAENTGTNADALAQWSLGFNVDQDLAQLVSARVQARLSRGGSPDRDYGLFFERAVKFTADNGYPGGLREADFWILRRSIGAESEDGPAEAQEVYHFYIVVSIDKELLEPAIDTALLTAAEYTKPSREETLAVDRIRAAFYEGF